MADEGKWYEYCKSKKLYWWSQYDEDREKMIYLDGLAEGRKEKCFEQNKDGTIRPCEVMKENAELKKQIQINEEIIIGEQQEINELQKKIEKMKCCGNCKHFMYGYCMTDKTCHINNEYKAWELAE